MNSEVTLTPIGIARTPYRQKFGVPRQPGLTPGVEGRICLLESVYQTGMLDGLEDFSHIWLLYWFHKTADKGWKPKVRPPRLGGQKTMGVLSTRAPYRPNPLGLSVVELLSIDQTGTAPELLVRAPDLVDGSPILDIKPYLPYSDQIMDASAGFSHKLDTQPLKVRFNQKALNDLSALGDSTRRESLIREVLSQDIRPAYWNEANHQYGVELEDMNIRFSIDEDSARVSEVSLLTGS